MKDATPEEMSEFQQMLATGSKAEHQAYDVRISARSATRQITETLERWTRATEAISGKDGKALAATSDAVRDLMQGLGQIYSQTARMHRSAAESDHFFEEENP